MKLEGNQAHLSKAEEVFQTEVIHDHDLNKASREEAMHHAALTEEELVIEKKLRRKIDSLIMPLVITV